MEAQSYTVMSLCYRGKEGGNFGIWAFADHLQYMHKNRYNTLPVRKNHKRHTGVSLRWMRWFTRSVSFHIHFFLPLHLCSLIILPSPDSSGQTDTEINIMKDKSRMPSLPIQPRANAHLSYHNASEENCCRYTPEACINSPHLKIKHTDCSILPESLYRYNHMNTIPPPGDVRYYWPVCACV